MSKKKKECRDGHQLYIDRDTAVQQNLEAIKAMIRPGNWRPPTKEKRVARPQARYDRHCEDSVPVEEETRLLMFDEAQAYMLEHEAAPYYFSQTGDTLVVALRCADDCSITIYDCRIRREKGYS